MNAVYDISKLQQSAIGIILAGAVAQPWNCALATAGEIEPQGAAIHVLDPVGAEALTIGGFATLSVIGGDVVVNSSNACALVTTQSPVINIPNLYLSGEACLNKTTVVNGTIHTNSTPAPDPLAALPEPSNEDLPVHGDVFNPGIVTLSPGIYPYGMRLTLSSNHVTLLPGIYVLGTPGGKMNRGLAILGGSFTANGCLLYIAAGAIDITANASVAISPLDSGPYWHVSIFQSRTNTAAASIWADSDSSLAGTLYMPNNVLQVAGGGFGIGSQWVTNRLFVGGAVPVNLIHDGAFPICWKDVAPVNGDGATNVLDLLEVINRWGPCDSCVADITRDGMVNVADLLEVINSWGTCLQRY